MVRPAMCAEVRGSDINVRGSQNAPYRGSYAGSALPSSYLLGPDGSARVRRGVPPRRS